MLGGLCEDSGGLLCGDDVESDSAMRRIMLLIGLAIRRFVMQFFLRRMVIAPTGALVPVVLSYESL